MTFDFDLLFFTWVTFAILFGLLARYGWKPILRALRSREEKIQNDLTRAEEQREKAEHLLDERKETLNEAHNEAREIIEEAREKGEQTREEIVKGAEEKAQSMVQRAEQEIEAEREQAFRQVEGEIGDLSVRLAERILRQEVDDEDHQRFVEDFLQDIEREAKVG